MAAESEYNAWFQSIHDPNERYQVDEVVYRAKDGALLEVVHDKDALRKTSAQEWKDLFRARNQVNQFPFGSGVWGKKEWVLPNIRNENVVSMFEGHTNLFWAERYGNGLGLDDLWIKQCGNTHTGSFKDLGMTVLVSMVKEMIARGKQLPAIACASTGDTSAALSAYAAAAGIPAVVFLPRGKVSVAQLIQPVANGAIVFALDTDFDGCMEIVQEISQKDGIYLANSMNSLRIEGQKTVGIEIVEQFDWEVPDWIVIPGGNLGNVSALAKGFDLMIDLGLVTKRPRIVCAQAEAANPLYLSYQKGFEVFEPIAARPTIANAIQIGNPVSIDKAISALKRYNGIQIGNPVSIDKAISALKRYNGIVEQASEGEIADACAGADRTGLFNCPHTGVALAAMEKLVKSGTIAKGERVVVLSTAHGLKFVDFKVRYHEMKLEGAGSQYANPPIELPASYGTVRDEMLRQIDQRFSG
ncbi:MAG: threonine synthase [Deltaproteobacteria bacterium]|nr:threonine synthase [Deltaproteobacteria bacterium]